MFIMAFDVLSLHLQDAIVRKTIQGVSFSGIGVRTLHNMYADDLAALIRAVLKYMEEFQRLLLWFGTLSGLHCDWEKTVASCVPAGPPPLALSHLPWKWEDATTATPLLGVPMAQSIAHARIETTLIQKVESKIDKYQALSLSFAARLLVANSMILGCFWYLLIMWAGKERFLKTLQRLVDKFVWKGRNRVARTTITLSKTTRGLGQIDIAAQYRALTGSPWQARTPFAIFYGAMWGRSHIDDGELRICRGWCRPVDTWSPGARALGVVFVGLGKVLNPRSL